MWPLVRRARYMRQDPFHTLDPDEYRACRKFVVVHPPRPGRERGEECWYPLESICEYVMNQTGVGPLRDPIRQRVWTWVELWRLCAATPAFSVRGATLRHVFMEKWYFGRGWPAVSIAQARGENLRVLAPRARMGCFRLPLYSRLPRFMEGALGRIGVEDRLRVLEGLLILDHHMMAWEVVREFRLHHHEKYINVEFWWAPVLANPVDMAINVYALRSVRTFLEHKMLPINGLHIACMRGQHEMVRLVLGLLDEEARQRLFARRAPYVVYRGCKAPFEPFDCGDWSSYWTPLQCAVGSPRGPALFRLLHQYNAQPPEPAENGETLFCIAIVNHHFELVPLLVQHYGLGYHEQAALMSLPSLEATERCLRQIGTLQRRFQWDHDARGEVWYRVLACYLDDINPSIQTLLGVIGMYRALFTNTAPPREVERYIAGEYGESWLAQLAGDPCPRRVRFVFVHRYLRSWGCEVPHRWVSPLLWSALGAPSTGEHWRCLLDYPLEWRDVYATLTFEANGGGVCLAPSTPYSTVIYRKYEALWGELEQLCAAALYLYRDAPCCEDATDHIAEATGPGRPPLTLLQRFVIKMLLKLQDPESVLERRMHDRLYKRAAPPPPPPPPPIAAGAACADDPEKG